MKKQKRRGRGLTILIVILALALTGAIVWGVAMAAQSLIQYGDSAQIGQKEEEEQISGESMDQEADTAPVEPELQEGLPRNRYDPACFIETDGIRTYDSDTVSGVAGVDVSAHQQDIDWAQVKAAGIEFAMIRLGYRGYVSGELALDEYFERNIQEALDAGLQVGVYFFSQALNEEEAVEEAEYVLYWLEHYDITYPVVFDWEEVSAADARTNEMNMLLLTSCAKAFCETIENAGYRAGIYFNQAYGYQQFNLLSLKDYIFWLAQYEEVPTFVYNFQMLQYSNSGTVPGIEGPVDLNICFWNKG